MVSTSKCTYMVGNRYTYLKGRHNNIKVDKGRKKKYKIIIYFKTVLFHIWFTYRYIWFIQSNSPSSRSPFYSITYFIQNLIFRTFKYTYRPYFKLLWFFCTTKDWPVEHLFLKLELSFSTLKYLVDIFSENVNISKSKFELAILELFDFVY